MANNIKGLTIEIDGDTTKLGKALDEVDKKSKDLSKELGEVNKLLKMDPGNAELLAQKQKILADAVENTSKRLETLKDAERQVQEQFQRGEVSEEQVRALQREVIACTKKLEGYENAAKETADAVENLGKKSKEALEETAQVNDKLAGGLAKGLGGVATIAAGAVTALAATAEETREYRTEMGKLDTAFAQSGFTADAAYSAYADLQGVLGESDQAVEAANHLAKLVDSEEDLAKWTGDILPGIFATFGDSLPIEGLTEAANETAKVGQVTGPLADALNWAGVSEDEFNEKLAKCSDEQERQKLIMETLNGLYGEASAAYKETNADVIAANKANEQWAAGMAEIGAFMEPAITEVKSFGAELLTYVVPALQAILDNLPAIGVAVAGVTAAMVAFKVASLAATAASQGMTLAQYAMAAAQKVLNAVMSANPIGLIILAITALVTAFMLLWNNCEGFREFWINLWEKIKGATQKAIDAVVDFFKSLPDRAQAMLDWFKNLPYKLGEFLGKAVGKAATWAVNMAKKAKETGKNFVQAVVDFFKQLPTKAATFLTNVVNKVASWRTSLVNKGKSAAKGLADAVVNGIKTLPSKITEIGKNLVKGLWNGITGMASWIKNKVTSFASGILDGFKSTFKINSPSKETQWMGEGLDEGLAKGIEENAKQPIKAMQNVSGGVLDATATEVGGIGFERGLSRRGSVAGAVAAVADNSALLSKLDGIYERLGRLQVVLDSGTLVGETIDKIDAALGNRQLLSARGV
jgi:phage-related minor tail protein